ncbi:MAG TPA: hypothetical protein VF573_02635 [Paraburkholderia sp.]|uniref:hypothetical protein n=1 Tax=Paraburkholderia sp. TaxID=1926495 RepID=UPI002ED08DB8
MNTKNIVAIGLATALCGCSALQQTSSQPQTTPTASPSSSSTARNNQQPTSTADGRSIQKVHVGKTDGEIVGTPAKNSKFAKVQIGMGKKEVEDLIGAPNDTHSYVTGKAFIPFYFGKDAYRIQTFYKKEGSLTFEGGGITGSSASGYTHLVA